MVDEEMIVGDEEMIVGDGEMIVRDGAMVAGTLAPAVDFCGKEYHLEVEVITNEPTIEVSCVLVKDECVGPGVGGNEAIDSGPKEQR